MAQRWVRHPLTILTAILAMVYGVGFPMGMDDHAWWMWGGAALVGLCFVASLVLSSRGRADGAA